MPTLRSAKKNNTSEEQELTMKSTIKEPDQWLFVGPDALLNDSDDDNKVFCRLPHPQNGIESLFLFHGKKIFEVMKFKESFRSWFIDETVQKDGALNFLTPVDPLFLVLPYLEISAKQGKYTTLDNILTDANHGNAMLKLEKNVTKESLLTICTCKGDEDYTAYKCDDEKILQWLCSKVQNVSKYLLQKSDVNVCSGAQLSTFKRTSAGNKNEDDCLHYAWTLVSDYVTKSWSEKLKQKLDIKEPVKEIRDVVEPAAKKQKLNNNNGECLEDYRDHSTKKTNSKKSAAKLTTGQKALQKVDKKGMRSMSSFFTSKPKK